MATHSADSAVGGGANRLPAGVVEDLLADETCRTLLQHLRERDTPVPVDDLAAVLVAARTGGSCSPRQRRRARAEIFQEWLPKLTATEVVHFDSLLGTVEYTGCPALTARLAAADGSSDRGTKDK